MMGRDCEICVYAAVRTTSEEWYHYCEMHKRRLVIDLDKPCDDFRSLL